MCIIKQEEQFIETAKNHQLSRENCFLWWEKIGSQKTALKCFNASQSPLPSVFDIDEAYDRRPQVTLMA